jgi:hypothetical protein
MDEWDAQVSLAMTLLRLSSFVMAESGPLRLLKGLKAGAGDAPGIILLG